MSKLFWNNAWKQSIDNLKFGKKMLRTNQNLSTKKTTEGFDRFGFPGSGRAVRISSESNSHGLGQSQVALVCKGRVNLELNFYSKK